MLVAIVLFYYFGSAVAKFDLTVSDVLNRNDGVLMFISAFCGEGVSPSVCSPNVTRSAFFFLTPSPCAR